MITKKEVYNAVLNSLSHKLSELKMALFEITEEAKTDSKSSAGDKHETSRAMMQNEQEKIIRQMEMLTEQLNQLQRINVDAPSERIFAGSMIKTNNGYFFLSVPLGKITVQNITVFVLSPTSPLGKLLIGLTKGQSASVKGVKYVVEEVWF
jgi:transcription elongation GreA/GreB family factor